MEYLWDTDLKDERLIRVRHNLRSAAENWTNDAASILRADHISIFEATRYTLERVYLIRNDCAIEPEVWVSDLNGEANTSTCWPI